MLPHLGTDKRKDDRHIVPIDELDGASREDGTTTAGAVNGQGQRKKSGAGTVNGQGQ